MTSAAVMVVPLVVPTTKTGSPVVTALAEACVASVRYVVVGTSLIVTCCPADVFNVKPDDDMALTVPTAPPDAGPERAFPPPPAGPAAPPALCAAVDAADVAVDVAGDAARLTETPVAVRPAATAATTHRPRLLDINRR
jgi:hypothetical protein